MRELAIQVEGIGKQYRLTGSRTSHGTFRDVLSAAARDVGDRLSAWSRGARIGRTKESFWALRDVWFEVAAGEVVGIIGGNGAGKSTLLKILSRITEPTEGTARIRGRVASLLEVGTGFHSELTGRENIYLNGAILGMTRREINQKFDDIVAFAEVERFIDTPVKHYSSGMYLRLAFAVAAHLEPEILIVDEVLAVGDASFQKKCLGKMSEVAHGGRTVLFVSHNLDAVRRLCSRCILLDRGRVVTAGDTLQVTSDYMSVAAERGRPNEWIDVSEEPRMGSGEARVTAMRYGGSMPGLAPCANGPLSVGVQILAKGTLRLHSFSFMIWDSLGNRLINAEIASLGKSVDLVPGLNVMEVQIEHLHLNCGTYLIGCWMSRNKGGERPLDYLERSISMDVIDAEDSGHLYPWALGPVTCNFEINLVPGKLEL